MKLFEQSIYRAETNEKVDEILEDATKGRKTTGSTKQWEKTGGYDEALEDFNKLNPQDVTDKSNEKGKTLVGTLKDGRIVNVRDHSSDNIPTLEIYDGKKSIKIRYRQN